MGLVGGTASPPPSAPPPSPAPTALPSRRSTRCWGVEGRTSVTGSDLLTPPVSAVPLPSQITVAPRSPSTPRPAPAGRGQASPRNPGRGCVPVAGLSIFDPIYLGIDENGHPVYLTLVGRNVLVGGEPGSGKSVLVQNVLGHAALSGDVRLVLLDGKEVELGMWEQIADVFVGPNLDVAIGVLRWLQAEIGRRTAALKQRRLRKITREHGVDVVLVVVDEIALYAATLGSKDQREEFQILLRDVVARGRAVGIPVVGATQRPSADIIPTSLRDIFGYRCAFRCTTDVSSDIILGFGWAGQGYSAMSIAPEDQG